MRRSQLLPTLKVSLLGPPIVALDGQRLELKPRKVLALLVYLAVTGNGQPRDGLAALFWPEANQREARAALSRRLSELAAALGAGWLENDRETIRLRACAESGHTLWLDVTEFRQRLDACQTQGHAATEVCAACAGQLAQAVALYRGDLLSGFTLRDCPGFDEWQFFQTEGLRQDQAAARERLARWYRGQDDPAAAVPHARAWLALDPLHEPAHRCLMELYARLGQRAAALRQYEECRRLLAEELNVPPDAATETLYAEIKSATRTAALAPSPAPAPPAPLMDEQPTTAPPTVFVGRARELAALAAALDEARSGHGQLRFVTGGAGQGKSMLVQEFVRQTQTADAKLLAVTGYCNAYTGISDPYLPFREVLDLLIGEVAASSAGEPITVEHARRLWAALPVTIPALVDHAPDLIGPFVAAQPLLARAASFASAHTPWFTQLTALAAGAKRLPLDESSIFSQYADALRVMAAAQPLLLILEDLHWADLASSGLLFHLSRAVRGSRILIVGTYRPEEMAQGLQGLPGADSHPLGAMMAEFKRQHGAIWLDLDGLTAAEGRQFVEAYVDSQPNRLDTAFRTALFRHTGGHALFTVELLSAMQARGDLHQDESGRWIASHAIDWGAMPAKVEGVIEKQLARLDSTAQAILRVACVQGESFSAEVIAHVLRLEQSTVVQQLSQELGRRYGLVSMEEVAWLGEMQLTRYRFRHYLFQRYLYQSLDEAERISRREAVGSALEQLYGDQVAQIVVPLAHHFRQAKLPAKAAGALLLAGQQARQLSIFHDAVKHFAEGLALLENLPETPARSRQELEYLLALGSAMDASGDFDTYELERILLRARALCRRLGDSAHVGPVLYMLAAVHFARGEYHQMNAYGEEMLRASQQQRDLEPHLMAYLILGIALQQLGDFTASSTYLERMLTSYEPALHHDVICQYAILDVRVMAYLHLAANEWLLGYPDRSRRHMEAASEVAAETTHSFTRVMALFMITWLHELRREVEETSRQATEVIRLATEHQFFFVLSHAAIYEGWALIEQQQAEAGLARLRQGISELHKYSQTKNQGYFATLQTRGYAALGQSQAGLDVIDAALAGVDQSGEHWYDAELYRLKGELLRMQGASVGVVQDCFEQAIAIARRQQAKMWELRATVSLCRLWQAQEQFAAAHDALAVTCDWFTEGFDTRDLLEAKALLAELASFSEARAHATSVPGGAKEIMVQDHVDVHLLGGFRITLNGQPLACLNQSRQQSLLAYLMLHADSPQSRQHVAFCFWPDSSEERAYANLRYALHQLRRSCPALKPFLEITQSTVQWCGRGVFRLDVAEYQASILQANEAADPTQACKQLIEAADLYHGDLLPSCYDEWIIPVRERLSQTHTQLLQQLVDRLVNQGEYQSAIDYANRLRSFDPFRELSYRRLMELHEATGDRAAALRVYHDCLSVLERELGVEPSPETRAVYERIMNPSAAQATPAPLSPPVIRTVMSDRLVGRQDEWRSLQGEWQTARQGQAHLVLICGAGGIGKTRLAEELVINANQHGHLTVRTRAYAAEGQLTYAPVIEWLRTDRYRDRLRALDRIWLVELARLFPELLSEIPDLPRPTPLTDKEQRRRLFEALAHAALSAGLPLLVLMDDLQWADQETLEWLRFLLRFNPSAALLVVGTARMEEVDAAHPLTALLMRLRDAGQVSEIELDALDAEASAELAQQAAGHALDDGTLARLLAYAEGVPLFLVEAVRAGIGKGKEETWRGHNGRAVDSMSSHTPVAIPSKVYAVLQARLAQLSPLARQLVDLAAVISRSFSVEFLAQASGASDAELVRGLDELWRRRIVRERGPDYDISHDRIRDVAYVELSPIQRRTLHRKVAQALEQIHGAELDATSAQLAWHYEHGGLPKQAIDYYRRAGMAAQRIYATNQAIDLFSKGLALLAELPSSPERDRQELPLQLALAASVRPRGIVLPEANRALTRAWELSQGVEHSEHSFWLLWGIHAYYLHKGELGRSMEIGKQLISISEREENPLFLLHAHTITGGTAHHIGNQGAARTHFARCANLYTPQLHNEQVTSGGLDFGIISAGWAAHNLWCLGYADQALQHSQSALKLAQQLATPLGQAIASTYAAMTHLLRGEQNATRTHAEAALALTTQHGFIYYGAWAALLAGWLLAWEHPGAEEIAALRRRLEDFRATGSSLRWPYYLSLLAEVYHRARQPDAGLAAIDEALAAAAAHNEHWWDAELYRLRGVLRLSQGADVRQVEAAFQQALSIARQQQARMLELRAATSLARLWRRRRSERACGTLSAVYGQFDEGFDTLDLQEAKALLAELS